MNFSTGQWFIQLLKEELGFSCVISLEKKELKEINADMLKVLDLPGNTLHKLMELLQQDETIDVFNISELLEVSGNKAEPILRLLENKNIDNKTILITLQTALNVKQKSTKPVKDFELCWTGPTSLDVRERATDSVMQEMIEKARVKIILVDYRITDKGETLKKLAESTGRVKEIIVIFDDDKKNINMSSIDNAFLGIKRPRIFSHKQKESYFYKVHAKILIIDGIEILVTSANLTYHGLNENFEMGIRIKGDPARDAETLLRKMIETKYFEEIP